MIALAFAATGVLFALIYYPTMRKLVEYWSTNDMYSYGFVIPFISAYLIWMRRHSFDWERIQPSVVAGVCVLTAGLLMLAMGRASATNLLEEVSLVISLSGLILLLLGTAAYRLVWFPIVYLFSMIPMWEFATAPLHPPFQWYSARIGVGVLRMIGIPVMHRGMTIELPNITLEVVEACSGVNYLISVLCIGIPLASMFVAGWPKRLLVVLSATVIALLSNGLRVAMVSVLAYRGGYDVDIHGPFGLLRSLAISGVGFLALFGLIGWLGDKKPPEAVTPRDTRMGVRFRVPHLSPLVIGLACLLLFVAFDRTHQVFATPLKAELSSLPEQIASWRALGRGTFSADFGNGHFDRTLSRNYVDGHGAEANLFVGYLERQSEGRELAGFALRSVLSMHQAFVYSLENGVEVKDSLVTRPAGSFHVTSWYVIDGRTLAQDYRVKLWTGTTALLARKSNGAAVVVKVRTDGTRSLESSRAVVRDFVTALTDLSKGISE